jgi:UDP-N-acetylmuramoylalanine--D-glutamate ligase
MNKKIVILGAAESGIGAALLAQKHGYEVFLSDSGNIKDSIKKELDAKQIRYEEGRHTEQRIFAADEVVKSPGIPEKTALMQQIRERKIPVISEIEFGFRHKGNSKIVAITGSNGKTTTTSMLFHIGNVAKLNCAACGNIGNSFAKQIAVDPKDWYFIEVSSFQLDDIKTFRPNIAILTNITEDHLDRYDYQFEKYITAKFNITKYLQKEDAFIYCLDDAVTAKYINNYTINSTNYPISMNKETKPGAFIKNGKMTIVRGSEIMEMNVNDFTVKGKHNQYNTMAAGLAASLIGIRKDKIREAITTWNLLLLLKALNI